jgi:hypothetical protein
VPVDGRESLSGRQCSLALAFFKRCHRGAIRSMLSTALTLAAWLAGVSIDDDGLEFQKRHVDPCLQEKRGLASIVQKHFRHINLTVHVGGALPTCASLPSQICSGLIESALGTSLSILRCTANCPHHVPTHPPPPPCPYIRRLLRTCAPLTHSVTSREPSTPCERLKTDPASATVGAPPTHHDGSPRPFPISKF